MVRSPCCDQKEHVRKGAWTKEEDERLISYVKRQGGEGSWKSLPKAAGLLRCGKSCRLRWINYLRPDLKRGNFTREEDELIINLQALLGNKWSLIASRLPGRTDNEIKNYWNTHIKRRLLDAGIHRQPQVKNTINKTMPSFHQRPLSISMQSGDAINTMVHNIPNVATMSDSASSDYTSSSSSTVLFSNQEIKPEISLELSMSLPQSHDATRINDKFKLEKKWEFYYPQLFGKSSSSSTVRPITKESVCLCYNLGGYQNGNSTVSSCNKCVCMNVDSTNRFYRPLSL